LFGEVPAGDPFDNMLREVTEPELPVGTLRLLAVALRKVRADVFPILYSIDCRGEWNV
jgi:hypothetical protein